MGLLHYTCGCGYAMLAVFMAQVLSTIMMEHMHHIIIMFVTWKKKYNQMHAQQAAIEGVWLALD